ncbi:MAG TPA: class II histone deacetylase [Thermoleophilaceae bacterium]
MTTGVCYDERCLRHDNGSMIVNDRVAGWLDVAHAEGAERLSRAWQVMQRAGVLERVERVPAREATDDELLLVHTPEHLERLRSSVRGDAVVTVGPEARAGPGSWAAASVATGGLLECVDRVVAGELANAYTLCRPPGHHASADQAMGFCLFNSLAIAARHLGRRHGIERVAIVDWDVHHGNGTQDVFYDDGSVLFVSLHQDALYPEDTGTLGERGTGAGEGATVNVPLPAGMSDDGYRLAFAQVVEPVLRRFGPEFLLLSAGQDAAASDPLGRMSVTTEGFRALAASARDLAEELCGGRLVAFQEGGYSVDHMPLCTLAILEALAELPPSWQSDPMELDVPTSVGESARHAVEAAARAAGVA